MKSHITAIQSNFAMGDVQPLVVNTRNPGLSFTAYNLAADVTVVEWPSLGGLLTLRWSGTGWSRWSASTT